MYLHENVVCIKVISDKQRVHSIVICVTKISLNAPCSYTIKGHESSLTMRIQKIKVIYNVEHH